MKRLSYKDLEAISKRVLTAYRKLPDIQGDHFYKVDPELLVSKVLGLTIGYEHLSLDGETLGTTSFTEIDVEVYDASDQPFFFPLDGKTVLVEKDLRSDITKQGRCHFSLMHEGSHHILKMLFPDEYGLVQGGVSPLRMYKASSEWRHPITNWEEWQTNVLTSNILLPEELVRQGMALFDLGEKLQILNRLFRRAEYNRFSDLAQFLGVSKQTLAIRMKQLGVLEEDQLTNPYRLLDVEMG